MADNSKGDDAKQPSSSSTSQLSSSSSNSQSDKNVYFDCSNSSSDKTSNNRLSVLSKNRLKPTAKRQRKTAVYRRAFNDNFEEEEPNNQLEDDCGPTKFPCVERLIEMYANIIKQKENELQTLMTLDKGDRLDKKCCVNENVEQTSLSHSPLSDEGWCTHQFSYDSSDEEENLSKMRLNKVDKVTRSSSSDSALGLDDELAASEHHQGSKSRRLTLTVNDIPLRSALLPVPQPTSLLSPNEMYSMTGDAPPMHVRNKLILEAQLIELPSEEQQQGNLKAPSSPASRRESSQSCMSDSGPHDGVRYMRTPSVVVSDYSDDVVCGITLEEIEYFRNHRLKRRNSNEYDSNESASSSCSNLNYCGSTISAFEGCDYQYSLMDERKVSDCSTCSAISCDDDEYITFPARPHPEGSSQPEEIVEQLDQIQLEKEQPEVQIVEELKIEELPVVVEPPVQRPKKVSI